jgi:hypothetical protein
MKQNYDDLISLLLFIFGSAKVWDLNQEPIPVRFSDQDNDRMEITSVAINSLHQLCVTDGPDENWGAITQDHKYAPMIVDAVHKRMRQDFGSIINERRIAV